MSLLVISVFLTSGCALELPSRLTRAGGAGVGGKLAFKLPVTKRHQDGFNQNPQGVWGWRGWGQFLGKSFLGDQVTRGEALDGGLVYTGV